MFFYKFAILMMASIVKSQECPPSTWKLSAPTCGYEDFVQELRKVFKNCNQNVGEYLKDIFEVDTEREVKERLAEICAEGGVPFQTITNKGPVFDKELYDGGTFYNEEREFQDSYGYVKERLSVSPGASIKQIYDEVADENVISWPEYIDNFQECKIRAAYCCFVADRQAGDNFGSCGKPYEEKCINAKPKKNTDICYHDMKRSPTSSRTSHGYALFKDNEDAGTVCHGFAWSDDATDISSRFKGNKLFVTSLYEELFKKGYVRSVPGAPMCGCLERMPTVSRADCTEVDLLNENVEFSYNKEDGMKAVDDVKIEFNRCNGVNNKNNDLAAYYHRLVNEGKATKEEKAVFDKAIVGEGKCEEAIDSFLEREGYERAPPPGPTQSPTLLAEREPFRVRAKYYNYFGDKLPVAGLSSLEPYMEEHIKEINFKQTGGNFAGSLRSENVAARFDGYLNFSEAGDYSLCISSDDGSKLFMDDDLFIDNDGLHGPRKKCETYTNPAANNVNLIVIEFFEKGGGASMIFSWKVPGSRVFVPVPEESWQLVGKKAR